MLTFSFFFSNNQISVLCMGKQKFKETLWIIWEPATGSSDSSSFCRVMLMRVSRGCWHSSPSTVGGSESMCDGVHDEKAGDQAFWLGPALCSKSSTFWWGKPLHPRGACGTVLWSKLGLWHAKHELKLPDLSPYSLISISFILVPFSRLPQTWNLLQEF